MGQSKTSKFYAKNPKSAEKRRESQREINKSEKQKKYRAELNKYNREHKAPKGDGKDATHKGGKIVGYESQKTNRARGGGKKK
jgi:hypothetical protein